MRVLAESTLLTWFRARLVAYPVHQARKRARSRELSEARANVTP